VLHGAPAHQEGEDGTFEGSFGWEVDFSEDEIEEVKAVFPGAVRSKDFFDRKEWTSLTAQGLTDKPVVKGCFFAYHKTDRKWECSYPDVPSMSHSHGGSTGLSAEHALLKVVHRMLEVHCSKNKKDKPWNQQFAKVVAALESMSK
jgi:hypothetical protein